MIKTFHEAPKSIFNTMQKMTDGDYALVNLFSEDAAYYKLFEDAVAAGREVILDNGVFELGEAWNADEYAEWVRRLKPTYYVVPDVLEDGPKTVESFFNFTEKYSDLPGKVLGVAQGKDYQEFVECYRAIELYCDKVGISFDCSWYREYSTSINPWKRLMEGRLQVLLQMERQGIINWNKPHHLLGVALPQEMKHYCLLQQHGSFNWIESVDTSNPVVHGLKGIAYGSDGLWSKETEKMYTLINAEVSEDQMGCIEHNVNFFRRFCNG